MENNILLSICIPTFNRANFLKVSLLQIISQLVENLPIEIIVSDNCSTDYTQEIINLYSNHSKFRHFKQIENIGGPKNGLKLIKEYARGQFCWVIGDDDYIVNGGIKSVVDIIKKYIEVDFIYVKVDSYKSDQDFILKKITNEIDFEIIDKFENLLNSKYSGLFLGEMMAEIFRRELWLKYEDIYGEIEHEYLSTLATTYPHCVIYANNFMGKKAIYIATPIVIVDDRAREWWDKVGYIIIEHIHSLLELYEKNGLRGKLLADCKFHFLEISFSKFNKFLFDKNAKYRNKVSFKRYLFFLICNPFITIKYIIYSINRKFRLLIINKKLNS